MQQLRITTVQSSLHWENIDANLERFSEKLAGLQNQTDLVVLPEMFTTGFSMNAQQLAETMDGKTMQWMASKAAETGAVITGSFIAREKGAFYNRLIWMRPDGTFDTYDKRHLFRLAKEDDFYKAGKKRLVTTWKGWKICPLICYDLRFPVWSRNTEAYDLLIYVANFPERRSKAWKNLLLARAIENQAFTVGVNRVGTDGKDIFYSGDTSVIDYAGHILYRASQVEAVFSTKISLSDLKTFRKRLAFLADSDDFELHFDVEALVR